MCFLSISGCVEGYSEAYDVFGEGIFYQAALEFSPIESFLCWPKQCDQPDPAIGSVGPATLTCANTLPIASAPVGFSYSFSVSLYGQTSSTAATTSTYPPSILATSASSTKNSSDPPLSWAPTTVGGSVNVMTGVPTVVPTGSQVCIEFNMCDVSTAAS
jgi:hypothetical protein